MKSRWYAHVFCEFRYITPGFKGSKIFKDFQTCTVRMRLFEILDFSRNISWLSSREWGVVWSSGWRKDDLRLKNSCGFLERWQPKGFLMFLQKNMGVSHLETAGDDSPPYLVDQDAEVPKISKHDWLGWCFQTMPRNIWTCESNGIIIIIINNSNSNNSNGD